MKKRGRGGPREMSQSDFEAMWADSIGASRAEAKRLLKALSRCVDIAIRSGKSVRIAGLGVFDLVADPPRRRYDLATSEPATSPARWNVKPIPSPKLVEAARSNGIPSAEDVRRYGRMARRKHADG